MNFRVDADLVALFRGLISALRPYASAQEVHLSFRSTVKSQCSNYHPEEIIPEITLLLTRIVAFTPQSYRVNVSIDKNASEENYFYLNIVNTGVSLSNIHEIPMSIKFKTTVENLNSEGTLFRVRIPINSFDGKTEKKLLATSTSNHFPQYYLEISKRLKSYFGNIGELEASAMQKGYSEGVFLKKVNAIITSHVQDNTFNVDILAAAVALSRTQLFRKIKLLTKMSPGRYILFFRLLRAKQLLQSRDKDLNVSEVCYAVGFVSKSHFTRSFQKQFGFNPSECK